MKSLYENIGIGDSVDPQTSSGTTEIDGAAVDTFGYNTAVLRARIALPTGGGTAGGCVVKLQECATSGGTFTDALDNTGVVIGGTTVVATTPVAGEVLARIEGLNLNRKRYLRVVITPAMTGGTPVAQVFGEILLARAYEKPTQSAVSNT